MNAIIGELVGTMILIILGGGVVGGVLLEGSKARNAGWLVITLGWGLAVAMAIYAVGKHSGAHINPAVTLALASIGAFPWAEVPGYLIAQFIGAFLGGIVVYFHYLPHWKNTNDPGLKLAVFSTDPGIRDVFGNMLSEFIGTFILLFGILAIGANEFTEGLNPLIIGLLIVSIGLSLGGTTGYAINPARDLGPRLAHFLLPIPGKGGSDWGYAWIPIVAPVAGGIHGALCYNALFKGEVNIAFISTSILVAIGFTIAFMKHSPPKVAKGAK